MGLRDEIKQKKPFASLEEEVYLSLRRTALVLREPWSRHLKASARLTPSQYNVLRILRGAESAGLSCTEIGERMVDRDPDITRLLDRLVKRRLVRRQRDEGDRRVVRAFITPSGLEVLAPLDAQVLRFTEQALGHLGPERLRLLRDLLAEAREGARPYP